MTRILFPVMLLMVIVAVALAPSGVVSAGQPPVDADEKSIRDAVARLDAENRVPQTPDSIFWSGSYKRPSVRGVNTAEFTNRAQAAKRESTEITTTIRRIEVSQSRDMAYEFSDGDLVVRELDASGTMAKRAFKNSTLRVWKKVNGQWHVAASFAHAHEP